MRRPPYTRLMLERAAEPRNQRQTHYVLIGSDGWQKAKTWSDYWHRVFVLCPPGDNPAEFDWSVYRDAPDPVGLVRCGDVDGDQLRRLVQAMLAAGSPRIFDLLADTVYRSSGRAAA